jgi:hypothetical protein
MLVYTNSKFTGQTKRETQNRKQALPNLMEKQRKKFKKKDTI